MGVPRIASPDPLVDADPRERRLARRRESARGFKNQPPILCPFRHVVSAFPDAVALTYNDHAKVSAAREPQGTSAQQGRPPAGGNREGFRWRQRLTASTVSLCPLSYIRRTCPLQLISCEDTSPLFFGAGRTIAT